MNTYQRSDKRVKNIDPHEEDPDRFLIEQAQDGDFHAFELLVIQHKQMLFRIIFSITRNQDDTEDMLQETLLRAYRGLHEFRRQSKFRTWLTRIAVNQALGCLRKRRYHHVSLDSCAGGNNGHMAPDIREWRPNPEQYCAQAETNLNVQEKIAKLPDGLRMALILKHFHGHTLERVAQELGITIPAAKSRVLRAHQRLRSQMEDQPFMIVREPSTKLLEYSIETF
ncbi:sigma-70 family RNA polymerase sigma factor [Terriglobus albidus]|uniref:Sigma-70 family RNA polymerase sigma factor n=1 Tax=Terriglobus albidus TaxID=1592106 RepID=A0A5B9ECL9_9BACT|nr:sigma-70 family RNA polymerase sigma factor [Terriglobus albidus]QEE28885.1 sigma-70 family RNA polymerase sigma factor [Terriglobus albidus]